jgi:hypothetical protein
MHKPRALRARGLLTGELGPRLSAETRAKLHL